MTAYNDITAPPQPPSLARLWHSGAFWTLIAIASWTLVAVPCCGVCGSLEFMPIPGRPPPGVPFEPTLSIRVDPADPKTAVITLPPSPIEPGVYWVHYDSEVKHHGFLSPTHASGPTVITSFQYTSNTGIPPQIAAAVLAAVAKEHPAHSASFRAAVAAGGSIERTIWAGYAQNALLFIFGGLALFATLRCAMLFARDAWSNRRFDPGNCRNCGYDLHGLTPKTAICPECGHAFVTRRRP